MRGSIRFGTLQEDAIIEAVLTPARKIARLEIDFGGETTTVDSSERS